jgi:hypothetical protein
MAELITEDTQINIGDWIIRPVINKPSERFLVVSLRDANSNQFEVYFNGKEGKFRL